METKELITTISMISFVIVISVGIFSFLFFTYTDKFKDTNNTSLACGNTTVTCPTCPTTSCNCPSQVCECNFPTSLSVIINNTNSS